jgi:rubrerythrin
VTSGEKPRDPAELRRAGPQWRLDPEDRPGDPVCLLYLVCPACGAVAEAEPPTSCPQCGGEIPAA